MKVFRNVLFLVIVNLVLFLLVFIMLEGGFRVAGIPYKVKYAPNENNFAQFDPELGWSYIPNKSTIHVPWDMDCHMKRALLVGSMLLMR